MTKIKFCGLTRLSNIEAANAVLPDYIGFVFVPGSRRYVPAETAAALRRQLAPGIRAVGVFADERPEAVAALLRRGIIDAAQLHGREDEAYIRRLRRLTEAPLIRAVSFTDASAAAAARESTADYVLLDSGRGGTGQPFDWSRIRELHRPFFLAGGLNAGNVAAALRLVSPYAVDVSSGIETDGIKDSKKMAAFAAAVRKDG